MDWNKCQAEYIRTVEPDIERCKSIITKAMQRLKRAESTEINNVTVSFVVEDYYEVIKELLVAYLLRAGLRSKNHQCLITYFAQNNPEYEHEANIIAQMSFFRNRLTYYGEDIPLAFYTKHVDIIRNIIKVIKKMIKL